ncbi:MAG: GGDEF domain-containing protein [Bdellovibrionales bacterium]|nr:GGDEF domain-containing protein [Bdellovibrionales bacterium]
MVYQILVLDSEAENFFKKKNLFETEGIQFHEYQKGYSERMLFAGGYDLVAYSSEDGQLIAQTLPLDECRVPNIVLKRDKKYLMGRDVFEVSVSHTDEPNQIVADITLVVERAYDEREKVGKGILLEMINDISGNVTPNTPSDVVKRALDVIDRNIGASAVYFMYKGEFDFYVRQMWKVQSISGKDFVNEPEFIPHKNSKPNNLSDLLQKIQGVLDSGWDETRTVNRVPGGHEVTDNTVIVPVFKGDKGEIEGHFFIVSPLDWPFARESKVVEYFSRFFGFALGYSETLESAKELTYVDDLTELYNQRYLKLVLDKEIDRAKRENGSFSVLFIDLDHFKRVNDTEGHLVGSNVLVQVGKFLKRSIRTTDYGFRYGGDEFTLLLIGMDAKAAAEAAERIRKNVENSIFRYDKIEIKVTLSIGVASYPEHAKSREEILKLADEAMYYGKHKSRNIVSVAS